MLNSAHSGELAASDDENLRNAVRHYMATLPPSERQILYERFVGRKTIAEISAELNIPEADIEAVLVRARTSARPSQADGGTGRAHRVADIADDKRRSA